MTQDRVPKEAGVQLQASTGSSMGGPGELLATNFTNVRAAQEGLLMLAGSSAAAAAGRHAAFARVQTLTNQVGSGCSVAAPASLPFSVQRDMYILQHAIAAIAAIFLARTSSLTG